jgi:pyruvate dehydrogenase E2 component (dihydrolipoamide acetyltransferase)
MASDVVMPRLSDSMEEGTVLKWLVEEGGEVKRGAPLVEIETDKANMTYEADTDGVLIEVVAKEGDTLAVGEVIARLGEEGEAPSGGGESESADEDEEAGEQAGDGDESGGDEEAAETEEAQAKAGSAQAKAGDRDEGDAEGGDSVEGAEEDQEEAASEAGDTAEQDSEPAKASADNGGERIKASPVARRMAGELGVELARLEGSGPGGRIVKADVEAAAQDGSASGDGASDGDEPAEEAAGAEAQDEGAAKPAAASKAPADDGEHGPKGAPEIVELSRLQRTVSRRMAESKATAPDFSLQIDVDMSGCVELRGRLKEESDQAPSYNDMVVKAAALALREHPKVNGAYRDGKFELYPRINVGVAVAAQGTLVVPVVRDADQVSLGEVSRRSRALIAKVRDGEITPPELSGATFTVSNLGMFGIDRFSAIINPPQAAILSVGSLDKRPAVDDRGRVVARDTMNLTLTCDHRILYGADGAEFLARVRELLQSPLSLAL